MIEVKDRHLFRAARKFIASQFTPAECMELLSTIKPDGSFFSYQVQVRDNASMFLFAPQQRRALRELVENKLTDLKLQHFIESAAVYGEFEQNLIQASILSKSDLTKETTIASFGDALKTVMDKRDEIIHFIPCQLMETQKPAEFHIGPVKFFSRKAARKRACQVMRVQQNEARKVGKSGYLPKIRDLKPVANSYSGFSRIATVKVCNATPAPSERIAIETVKAAVCILHLLYPNNSNKMRVLEGSNQHTNFAKFSIGLTAGAATTRGWDSMGSVAFPDDWVEDLNRDPMARCIIGKARTLLESTLNPALDRTISRRLLLALHWFSEAVKDSNPAFQMAKFIYAIEAVLRVYNADDGNSDLVSKRGSVLCQYMFGPNEPWEEIIRDAYPTRNAISHGEMRPEAYLRCTDIKKAAEAILTAAFLLYSDDVLRQENLTRKQVKSGIEEIVETMSQTISTV